MSRLVPESMDRGAALAGAYMLLAMREAGEWFVKIEYRRNAIVYLYAASSEVSIFADGDVVTIKSDDPRRRRNWAASVLTTSSSMFTPTTRDE